MSIAATKLHYEVRRKINRINSDFSKSISVPDLDAYINEAKDLVYENFAVVFERNTTVRNHLRQLEVNNKCLACKNDAEDSCIVEYPKDFYRLTRQIAKATTDGCDSERELIIHITKQDKLSESLKDPYWDPDFFYEETLGDDEETGLRVYHNGKFDVKEVCISYLKIIPDIAAPSLVSSGSYTDPEGNTVSRNVDFIVDSSFLWRKIVDVAVLGIQRDMSNVNDYQTQLQNILQLDKVYLV